MSKKWTPKAPEKNAYLQDAAPPHERYVWEDEIQNRIRYPLSGSAITVEEEQEVDALRKILNGKSQGLTKRDAISLVKTPLEKKEWLLQKSPLSAKSKDGESSNAILRF